jgi:predicted sulfurtransferase
VSIREQDLTYTQDLVTAEPHHLTPKDWHTELQQKKQNVFLLDMRNQFE